MEKQRLNLSLGKWAGVYYGNHQRFRLVGNRHLMLLTDKANFQEVKAWLININSPIGEMK